MRKTLLPMILQLFADDPAETGAAAGGEGTTPHNAEPPQIDYDKIADIVAGKQKIAEDTVLKSYFKQQGLSKEDAEQAMLAFKEKQKENTPDVNALQTQITQAQNMAMQANIERDGFVIGTELGLDVKTIPYVMKLADTSAVVADGKINQDKLKEAINAVLEDVPALKSTNKTDDGKGFVQVGAPGQGSSAAQQGNNTPQPPKKRWNSWN